jgi:Leucine-rich repeat (LRR) protein
MNFIYSFLVISLILSLSAAVILECVYENDDKQNYSCKAKELETSEDDNLITIVNGKHAEGKDNTHVKKFLAEHQNCVYFPAGLSEHFLNLETIVITNSSLEYIFKSDLEGLSELKNLTVVSNKVESLGSGLFEHNSKLEEIHFENNKLKHISENIFDPLEELKVAHFYNNPCIKEDPQYDGGWTDIQEFIKENCPFELETANKIHDKEITILQAQLVRAKAEIEKK